MTIDIEDLRYTKEHTWVSLDDNVATIGISDHAQAELGDIVFVELPEVGAEVTQYSEFGVVESTKTVSDLFAPVTGTVTEVNEALLDSPETLNSDPLGEGWLITVDVSDPTELDDLMSADEYAKFVKEEE